MPCHAVPCRAVPCRARLCLGSCGLSSRDAPVARDNSRGSRRRCLRDTNVTIRWLILHRVTMNKKLAELCASAVNPDEILKVRL